MSKYHGIAARRYVLQHQAYSKLPELPILEIEILAEDIVSSWSRQEAKIIQGVVEGIRDNLAKENAPLNTSITTACDNLQSMLLQMLNIKSEFRNAFAGKEKVSFLEYSSHLKETISDWHKITNDIFFDLELISGHEQMIKVFLLMISQLSGDFIATEIAIDSPKWV